MLTLRRAGILRAARSKLGEIYFYIYIKDTMRISKYVVELVIYLFISLFVEVDQSPRLIF